MHWFENKLNREIQKSVSRVTPPYVPTDVDSKKLLCTYLPTLKMLVAVYSEPEVIQVINYADCHLSNYMIEVLRKIALEKKIKSKVNLGYYIAQHHNINFRSINLHGSSMHAKNAFQIERRRNISTTLPCYASWYEYIADVLAAVICHNAQTSESYLKTVAGILGGIELILPSEFTASLKEFDIENSHLNNDAAEDITFILSRAVNLQKLLLGRNNLGTLGVVKIMQAMCDISKLRILNISSNNICADAANDIAAFLAHNTKLKELYLGGNNLCTEGAVNIMRGLKRTSSLTVLDLASNNIDDEAADNIVIVLSHNPKLEELYLGGNNLQAAGIFKIARTLHTTTNIKLFNIENSYANFTLYIYQVVHAHMFKNDLESFFSHNLCPLQLYLCGDSKYEVGTLKKSRLSILKRSLISTSSLTILDVDNQLTTEIPNDENSLAQGSNGILMMLDTVSGNTSEVTVNDFKSVFDYANIEVLHLHGNNMQAKNTLTILGALRSSKSLCTFDMDNNHNFSDTAVDDIKYILNRNNKLQRFSAGGNYLGIIKAHVILQGLLNTSHMTSFNVSNNNLSGEAADDIAAVLMQNINLQELYLSNNNLDMSKIAGGLQGTTTLTALDVSNNGIGTEAANCLATILQCSCKLQELYLQNNNLQTAGFIEIADALQTLETLKIFDVSNNNVGIEAESRIASLIHRNSSKLQKLYLGGNSLCKLGYVDLLLPSLHVLSIPNINIADEAVDDVSKMIFHNAKLQVLDLHGNHFGTQGAIKMLNALKEHVELVHLNIENNDIEGGKVADDLAVVLSHNKRLKKLYFGDVKLKYSGVLKIQKSLQDVSDLTVFSLPNSNIDCVSADGIAKILSSNKKLQELYLSGNNLLAQGITKITRVLHNISSLTVFDISNNKISDKAADDIAVLLSHNSKLEVLKLGGNNLQTAGVIKIAKALKYASCLIILDISNNGIDSSAAQDIAHVLSCNHKLQKLHFQGNNLKADGVNVIAKGLQGATSLLAFDISNNDISDEAADNIAAIFSNNSKLQEVQLHSNVFQHTGITKIAKSLQTISTMTVFSISGNRISNKAAKDIATVLNHSTKLKELHMANTFLDELVVVEIMNALWNISTLRILDISQNSINQNAVKDIAASLCRYTQLCQLHIGQNCLQTVGTIEIMHSLRDTTTLTLLDISENNIADKAADMIASVLSNNVKLQVLNVSRNKFQALGIIRILSALRHTVTLEVIDISNINIGDEAVDEICAVISLSTKLRLLHLVGVNINVPSILKVAKALQNVKSQTILNISSNGISDETHHEIKSITARNVTLKLHD